MFQLVEGPESRERLLWRLVTVTLAGGVPKPVMHQELYTLILYS